MMPERKQGRMNELGVRVRDEAAAGLWEKEPLRSTAGTLVLVLDVGQSADCETRTSLVLRVFRNRVSVLMKFLKHKSLNLGRVRICIFFLNDFFL